MIVRAYNGLDELAATTEQPDAKGTAYHARLAMDYGHSVILTLTPSIELALPRTSTAAEIENEIRAMIGP